MLAKGHRHRHMQFCLLMGAHVMKGRWPLNSLVHAIHVKTVMLPADSLLVLAACCHVPRRSQDHSC